MIAKKISAKNITKNRKNMIIMNNKVKILGMFIAILTTATVADCSANGTNSIEPEANWHPEGGKSGPIQQLRVDVEYGDNSIPGVVLTCASREKAWNKIILPVNVNINKYNTLKFKFKIEAPDGAPKSFAVYLLDKKGGWCVCRTGRFSKKLRDGWNQFTWDAVNQPQIVKDIDLDKCTRMAISYPYAKIPEDRTVKITIIDLQFVKGLRATTGDPKLFAKWKNFANTYKPDYSDSSKYLLPPEKGRLRKPLTLYADGEPQGEIIIPDDADQVLKTAAAELVLWLEKIAGKPLKITTKDKRSANIAIFLGDCGKHTDDIGKLKGSDGFAVRSDGQNIRIFGATSKGTLNGVFAFLENNTDIIWARPSVDFGTVYSKNPNLKILWGDAVERPSARIRGWQPNLGGGKAFWRWADRNRDNYFNSPPAESAAWGDFSTYGGGHNLQSFLPKGKQKYHPVIKGKRVEKLNIWKHQICFASPDLVDVYSKNVIEYIRKKAPKGISAFNINIEDNKGVCECGKCSAPIKLPDGTFLEKDDPAFRSTQFFIFLNKVTSKVNEAYPDLKIMTYAYFFTATPPKVKLNPNIYVLFCPYVRKDQTTPMCSPMNDTWWNRLMKWKDKTNNIIIREYFGIFNGGRPYAEILDFDTKAYLARNINNFTSEINPDLKRVWWDGQIRGSMDSLDLNMMEYWLANKIYWNPYASVEQQRKYFIRRVFREAAPEMERFFGVLRESWYKNSQPYGFLEGPTFVRVAVLHRKTEEKELEYLREAALKVKHPVSKILVHRVKTRFEQWLKKAKSGRMKTTKKEILAEKLRFGWGGELPDASARATTVLVKGKPTDVLRLKFEKKGHPYRVVKHLRPDLLQIIKNPVLSFKIIPSETTAACAFPLPDVFVEDCKGRKIKSPKSAYSKEKNGWTKFKWNTMEMRPRKIMFKFNYEKLPKGKSAVFYIIDLLLESD